jgi:hypothetical protein
MPRIWFRLPTGTPPPELAPYRDDPKRLEEYIRLAVEAEGARLENLYFDVGRQTAYALVADLDDYIRAKAVCGALGVEDATKIITVEQAVEAVEREQVIRDRLSQS